MLQKIAPNCIYSALFYLEPLSCRRTIFQMQRTVIQYEMMTKGGEKTLRNGLKKTGKHSCRWRDDFKCLGEGAIARNANTVRHSDRIKCLRIKLLILSLWRSGGCLLSIQFEETIYNKKSYLKNVRPAANIMMITKRAMAPAARRYGVKSGMEKDAVV